MNFDLRMQAQALEALPNALNVIQNAQLLRRAEEQENAFWFKHALVQDTAYASLMRHDRKRLHRLVAETLERMNPEELDELAPRLAEHFEEAGETARALFYLERAAENAAAQYANREALNFYTRALDAANELQTDTRDSLHRARGVVYERIGKFDEACADLENALRIARQTGDAHAEWQSLMDLGFAWTARDYARAGEYFEKALELARASGDDSRLAHTLNRVGNWYVNADEPQRAKAYHAEALEMFQRLRIVRGVAETRDLLSMVHWLGADYLGAEQHTEAALALFRELGDPLAIVNMRTVSFLRCALLQGDTVVVSPGWRAMHQGDPEILQELQHLGWRAGEAFGLMVLGEGFAATGEYARGLDMLYEALTLAREIHHRQWLAGATMLYGEVLARLLNFETAQPYLENALQLARELGSMHWMRTGSGFLASVLVAQNQLERAAEILETALPLNTPAQTVGQRQAWAARVELALAQNKTDAASDALNLLLENLANLAPETVIPRLWLLRARTLMQAPQENSLEQAEALLRAAQIDAQQTKQPAWEWRSDALLAQLYRAQGRDADAERAANRATQVVTRLASAITEETVGETFLTRARQKIYGA